MDHPGCWTYQAEIGNRMRCTCENDVEGEHRVLHETPVIAPEARKPRTPNSRHSFVPDPFEEGTRLGKLGRLIYEMFRGLRDTHQAVSV